MGHDDREKVHHLMDDRAQFDNGVAVGKMYAANPFWWWGFWTGQALGTMSQWNKEAK